MLIYRGRLGTEVEKEKIESEKKRTVPRLKGRRAGDEEQGRG